MHLVLGATGGVGHWVVEKLVQRREDVRVMVRDPGKVRHWAGAQRVEIVEGDALDRKDVEKAADRVESIYHCVNVPYPEWKVKVIPMLQNTIAAAKPGKAKIVFPGNVYVFGHARTEYVGENHPFAAHTKKGRIRIRMERMLGELWKSEGIPYVIVRMPDFYGPFVPNPIYASIFRNALQGRPMTWYGALDVPREFSYIEDAAEALVMAGLDPATAGETYHLPGTQVTTAREWLQLIASKAGAGSKTRTVPAFAVALAGLFNPLAREAREMLYLYTERLILDGAKFRQKFGRIPSTPYETGVTRTLEWFRRG